MLAILDDTLRFKKTAGKQWHPVYRTCSVYADQDVYITEVQRLQRRPLFQILGHTLKSDAPDLFRPCATQRLYIHGHPDFENINEVTP